MAYEVRKEAVLVLCTSSHTPVPMEPVDLLAFLSPSPPPPILNLELKAAERARAAAASSGLIFQPRRAMHCDCDCEVRYRMSLLFLQRIEQDESRPLPRV